MKKTLLVILALLLVHAPWRIALVTAEALYLNPGLTQEVTTNDKYWQVMELESKLIAYGFEVQYKKQVDLLGDPAYGVIDPAMHTITIDASLSWDMRYAVLAHEAGHHLQPVWANRNQREVFAELVSTLVSHDGYREHARYLARTKIDLLVMVLLDWPAVYHAAAVLEDR